MNSTWAIVGHALMIPVVVAALAATAYLAFHLDTHKRVGRRLGDPLDPDLVRRWNARGA